jgi:hypothetical protein
MDNVTARINQGYLLLPNPALMSSSGAAISRAMAILSPVIMDERVVQFINSIRQQDMRTELLKIFWAAKDSGADIPIAEDHMITNRTYLTSISFLLSSPGIPHPDMMKMFDEVDRVFNEEQEEHIRAEAADIMHRFYPVRGERMLDELRHDLNIGRQPQIPHDNEEVIRMIRQQPEQQQDQANAPLQDLRRLRRLAAIVDAEHGVNKKVVIYDDSQNVHNTTINESVIAAARSLIEEMIATVTFDGRYKFTVFRGDTVTSITNRLADVLKRFPEDVTILGDGDKQELQPRMTYRILKDAKSTIEVSRFNPDEVDRYMEVIGMEDYIFPNNVVRDGDLGRRLEEIFLVTNRCLTSVFEDKAEEELLFYLDLCGIPDAEMIWFEREEILKDLYVVIGNERQRDEDINEFLDEIFDDIFPDREMGSFIRRIKTSSVRDIKLLDLLNAVWKFIHTKQGETFTEMKKRLREEILEGMEVCTSGVCAHLVSVIQGYFDEDKQPSLKIKMSLVDELQARLTQNINALAMEREVDPVMESDNFKKLIDEYVDMNAKDILDGFTDDDIRMSGLSKQMIIDVAYKSYRIGENMGEDVPDTAP